MLRTWLWLWKVGVFSKSTWRAALWMVALFALFGHSGPVSQLTRVLAAAAGLAETSSLAASSAVVAAANLTTVSSAMAVQLLGRGASTMHDFWQGVDLVNVSAQLEHGRLAGADGDEIAEWLFSEEGNHTFALAPATRSAVASAARATSLARPQVEQASQTLIGLTAYVVWQVGARLLPNAYVAIRWVQRRVSFQPRWSNPLWEALEHNLTSQSQQILAAVTDSLEALPAAGL